MKNLINLLFAAMLCVGCLFADTNEILCIAFIGIVGGVMAVKDYRKQRAYEEAKNKSNNIDYLLDCVEFGEWEMN